MKTLILIVILFITFSQAKSQEAFVLGKTYRQGWVVWYPTNAPGNMYKSIPITFTAKKTPDQDAANWIKTQDNTPVPAGYVKQASFDSVVTQLNSVLNDVKALKLLTGSLRVSQTAVPLITMGSDGVLQMRSIRLAPTSGLDAKVVNGEIVIDKK